MNIQMLDIFKELEGYYDTHKGISGDLHDWNLNYLRNHRSRYISDFQLLKKYYSTGNILELGSAPFHFTYLLKRMGLPVTGVDIEPQRFQDFLSENDIKVTKCNVETEPLPFDDGSFHVILFNEIFEHMRIDPIQTLENIRRVLHRDGYLILSTPNLYSVPTVVNFLLGKGFDDPYEQFAKLRKFGHMGHVREYSVKQVRKFLENTGYREVEVKLQSHRAMKGLWSPFNLVRNVMPGLHAFQTHVCKVA